MKYTLKDLAFAFMAAMGIYASALFTYGICTSDTSGSFWVLMLISLHTIVMITMSLICIKELFNPTKKEE